jgi:hypothetical protein
MKLENVGFFSNSLAFNIEESNDSFNMKFFEHLNKFDDDKKEYLKLTQNREISPPNLKNNKLATLIQHHKQSKITKSPPKKMKLNESDKFITPKYYKKLIRGNKKKTSS